MVKNKATEKIFSIPRSIGLRIALPTLAMVILFMGAKFFVQLPTLEREILTQKVETSKRLVETALAMIEHHHQLAQRGLQTEAEAKIVAKEQLRGLRYGKQGKEYFWIIDHTPTTVMHPYRPDMEGKNITDLRDADGVPLFKVMAEMARNGGGKVRYRWQWKDQPDRIEEKISWVKEFEPWGWVVGTGFYLEDVRAEIKNIKRNMLATSGLVMLGVAFLALVIIYQAQRVAWKQVNIWKDLEQERERYRSLVDHLGIGVVRVDLDFRVMAANRQFKAWFPRIVPESGARSLELFGLGPDDPVPADCAVNLTLQDGQVHETHHGVMIHGQERQLRLVSSPVQGLDGGLSSVIVMLDDFTERIERDRELAQAEAKYRGIFENAVEGIYQTSGAGELLSANPAMVELMGYSSEEELKEKLRQDPQKLYVRPHRHEEFLALLRKGGAVEAFESEVKTSSGDIIWVLERASAVRNASGELLHINGMLLDITSRKQTQAALERQRTYFRELFESSPLAIAMVDETGKIVRVNKGFEQLFGFATSSLNGCRSRDVIVPADRLEESDSLLRDICRGISVSKETVRKHRDGTRLPVHLVGYPFRVEGKVGGAYHIYQDITERKNFEKQLSHQAFHDSLTALPNRLLYMERLSRAVQRSHRRKNYRFAAMMIDLDSFKRINDRLGHQTGDQVLVGVGQRILSCIRSVDTVARLGGDEFAVLLEEFDNPREVIQVANRIRDLLKEPFSLDKQQAQTGASIGIVLDIRGYERAEEILRDADIAMYRCKEHGKDRLIFNRGMRQKVLEEGRMESELRTALEEEQFILHYQPVIEVKSGELKGFEALVRWEHPSRGLLPPMEFIPLAEETGVILPLGRWVLSEACSQIERWSHRENGQHANNLSMSVNLSAKQFAQQGLVGFVQDILEKDGLDPGRLKLEITETVLMENARQAARKLNRLKELGLQVMVDDFGTGYSSLAYLQQFPVDYLKIDKTFISGEGDAADNREIVNTIILLARNLGIKVVAEGVEKQEHLDMLKELACDCAQGFLFSPPVASSQVAEIIRRFPASPPEKPRG